MSLPRSEWLDLAKRLPVGRSDRVRHGFESRSNLLISNHPDRWSAHCFACNESGVVFKEHVRLDVAPQAEQRYTKWPSDAVPFESASELDRRRVLSLLASKGIDYGTMMQGLGALYSRTDQRLLLKSGQGWLGRALNPRQPTKWVVYPEGGEYAHYATHPEDTVQGTVVLTEDFLSALKVRKACPDVVPVALLGTSIRQQLLARLLECRVLVMLDGDAAGQAGTEKALKRLRGLGVHVRPVTVAAGKDPKDEPLAEIRRLVYAAV